MVKWTPSPLKLHALTTGRTGTTSFNFSLPPYPNVLYRVISINVDSTQKFRQVMLEAKYDDGNWYNLFVGYICGGALVSNKRIDIDGDKLTSPPNLRVRVPNLASTDLTRVEVDLLQGERE